MASGRRIAVTLCCLALAVAAGCGGDKAPTKSAFVEQAGKICASAGQKLEAAGKSYFSSHPGATEAQFVRARVVPIVTKDLIDPIDALTTPKGDEDEVDGILNAGRNALKKLEQNPELIRAPAGSPKDPFLQFGRRATQYGLKCGGS